MQDYHSLRALLDRYLTGQTSPAEDALLLEILEISDNADPESLLEAYWNRLREGAVSLTEQEIHSGAAPEMLRNILAGSSTKGRPNPLKAVQPERRMTLTAGTGLLTVEGAAELRHAEGMLEYVAQSPGEQELCYNTMSTPKGRQYQLVLSDGTKVWLNAASAITYPTRFPGSDRAVSLIGEAYFEVAPDASRPFRVHVAGRGEVEVLGTHFNVNAYADEPSMNTTVLEGSVRVSALHTGNSSVLRPGQQAQVQRDIAVVDDVDTEEVIAWKNGYFVFNGATTESIMRQVNRWYDAEIVYEGDVRNERFSGSVPRTASASRLLEVLELTRTVRFKIEGQKIIVNPY